MLLTEEYKNFADMPNCLLCSSAYYWTSPVTGICWTCFTGLRNNP